MSSVDYIVYAPVKQPAKGELLLELLSEEIPARMQRRAIEDLRRHLDEWLKASRIRGAEPIVGYVTPRRLTVIANGIPMWQPPWKEEKRGPRVGSPQHAIEGFLRSAGIASIEECEVRAIDRGEFYFALIERPGRAAADVLPDLIYSTIWDVAWPKSMRSPASSLRWVRPLTSVLCLFDGKIVPLSLDRVPVGRTTRGHRFLAPGEISVEDAADYRKRLRQAMVILDQDQREEMIERDLEAAAASEGLSVKPDPALLDEVTGLVEFPVVLAGTIDPQFTALPPEVLVTAMRAHQKYFCCLRTDRALAPRFLFVANNLAVDGGKTIIAGNERVLRARLADARFFWDLDRQTKLESRVEALKERVFHARLGSVHDMVVRMEALAEFLVPYVPNSNVRLSRRALRLAKADLSTGMVGEFPELQGIMGGYYATHDREHPAVALAIAEHYKPRGPNDDCPTAPDSIVAALADKIVTLVSFFSINEKPTGSRDPFALRRAAVGVIRLIIDNGLRLPISTLLGHTVSLSLSVESINPRTLAARAAHSGISPTLVIHELTSFIIERLKIHLREQGVRHDLIAAVFEPVGERGREDDLVRLLARVAALGSFLISEDGANLLVAYRRASNIVAIEERRDGPHEGEINPELLHQSEEKELDGHLHEAALLVGTFMAHEEFEGAMGQLARLRRPVDQFFDKVTVNCDQPALRENRLRLLSRLRSMMDQVADFSQIEG
jgi:glycyl-tRNA synthetase beta chain